MTQRQPIMVIDLRCLQDPAYAERGIGNHARNLIRHAPPGWVGIFDPALPPLPAEVAALAGELSPHGYVPGAGLFLNPSPFSPEQNFCARLLTSPGVRKAACVYDFIPYDEPQRYLAHPIPRLEYHAALAWLRHYDVFFPISALTETRLRELFGPVASLVTGVGLPPFLDRLPSATPRHLLMVGGDDARKNPELLVRAHASRPELAKLPLVITGDHGQKTQARLRALGPVELPGRVSNAHMAELYAGALAVVTPSRAEGFSMPVVEAAAAGVPSLASDIPAHRALLAEEFLFDPDDAAALADLLVRTLASPAAVIASQAGLAAPYRAPAVAARLFGHLAPLPAFSITRGALPNLALLTPMPPTRSGVADHAAALLPALRRHARVTLFSEAVSPLAVLPGRFDAVLGVIGNAPLHRPVHDLIAQHGGAALCHDARLPGLFSGAGLAAMAREAAAELGRAVEEDEILRWSQDEAQRQASFLRPLAQAARPLIFHAPQPAAFCREVFGADAVQLPFPMMRPPALRDPAARARARDLLQVGPKEKLIVSFGFLTQGKGIELALAAFARLRETHPTARLVFAGAAQIDPGPWQSLAETLGVSAFVQLGTGFLSAETYSLWLTAADAGLQLRLGQSGAISAALQDCIGAGLNSVASSTLAENIAAPAYIIRVGDNVDEIARALADCLSSPPPDGETRTTYCATHAMPAYAARLLELLLT